MDIIKSSLQSLEWFRFLEQYSGFCASLPAKLQALHLEIPDEQAESEKLLQLSQEGLGIIEMEQFPPISSLQEMATPFQRLAKAACLTGQELHAFAKLMEISHQVRQVFQKTKDKFPECHALASSITSFPDLQKKISHCIEPDGGVKDSASSRLGKLRREEQKAHERAREAVEKILRRAIRAGIAQDQYFDIRDGRYVIPIKRAYRKQVPGLSFESSTSRATAYVEPFALRDWNDKIRQIQIDIEEEVYKILHELTGKLVPHSEVLWENYNSTIRIDLTLGRARFAQDFQSYKHATPVTFSSTMELLDLYHPLLRKLLPAEELVTNSVLIPPDTHCVIISGPNTGGKTVLLKAMGLLAMMSRCGFLLPCGENSTIPYFKKVLVQIGDEQNIEEHLSSFSSSVAIIKNILEIADSSTLVLIDEILNSTDPAEATALSGAILSELTQRGVTVFVTTHFSELKEMEAENLLHASMEFDVKKMEPKYRIRLGIPSSSWAIETAQRLGIPSKIIQDATRRFQDSHGKVDHLITKIESKESEIESARKELDEKKIEMERELKRTTEMQKKVQSERENLGIRFEAEIKKIKAQAFAEASTIVQEYKGKLEKLPHMYEEVVKGSRRLLQAKAIEVPQEFQSTPKETESKNVFMRVGAVVKIQNLRMKGKLLNDPKNKQAEVQVGNMKVRAPWDELILLEEDSTKNKKKHSPGTRTSLSISDCPEELNLIGLRVEDATTRLEEFLDRAVRSTRISVRIIHGHGSGALKKATRLFLKNSAYGVQFHPGSNEEGGDGCTIVELENV